MFNVHYLNVHRIINVKANEHTAQKYKNNENYYFNKLNNFTIDFAKYIIRSLNCTILIN